MVWRRDLHPSKQLLGGSELAFVECEHVGHWDLILQTSTAPQTLHVSVCKEPVRTTVPGSVSSQTAWGLCTSEPSKGLA